METLRAELQLDLSSFTASLATATQQIQQFAANTSRALQSAVAALAPLTQAQQATAQSTTQTSQAYAQWIIQLQNVTQAIRQQTATGQAAVAAQQQTTTAVQATTQAVQALGQAQHQNTQATQTWAGALQVAGGLGLATSLQAVVGAVKNFVTESVQVAVKMQALESSFRAITGSAAGAQREFTFLRETAQHTATDFVTLAQSYKNFEAAARGTSLEGQGVRNIFTAIAEASRVLGLSTFETHRTLVALEQMMTKGKASAEELRRQMQGLPGAFQIAARAMGVTTDQLDQMLRSGQLLSEDFLPRFAAQLRRELGPGLEASTKTAAASFARLGNEVTAMATEVGNAVLKIVQPIADFLTKTLAAVREVRERSQGEAGKAAADAVAGKPTFLGGTQAFQVPGGATEAQTQRIIELNALLVSETLSLQQGEATLANQRSKNAAWYERVWTPTLEKNLARERELHAAHEQEFRDLVKAAEAQGRVDQNIAMQDNEELSKGVLGKNIVEATARQKKQVDELLTLHKQLPLELQKAALIADSFPTIYEKTEEKLSVVKKSIEAIAEKLRAKPDLAALPEVQKLLKAEEALAATLQTQIDQAKELEQAEAARARAAEQTLERRKKLLNDVMQGGDFKLRSSDLEEITADLAAFNEMLTTVTGKRLDAVRTILQGLEEAKQKALGTFPTALIEGLEALGEAWGALEEDNKKGRKAAEDFVEAQEKLNVVLGKGTSEFEAQRIKFRQYIADLEKIVGVTEKTQEALRVGLKVIDDKELDKGARAIEKSAHDAERAAREAMRPWKELAHEVQSTLATAFEGLLSGTLDIFDAIKKAFIHLLADLAAAALTPILINAVMGLMGGGMGVGGGSLGTVGAWGGGEGGGAGGAALGMVGQAAGVVGMGRMFGGNALINQLLAHELFTVGGSVGGAAAGDIAGAGSWGAADAMGTAGAVGGTSISAGSLLGGIGMGVGAGMLISKLNSMMGLHGTANTMLSSTAGGAIGGTMILPGIGTAIGAAVGAIAGAIISLLSKTAQPTVDIQHVRQGVVGMEPGHGLSLQTGFQINRTSVGDIRGLDTKAFVGQLNASVDSLFTQAIEGFRGAAPEVQAALVTPLNEIARQIGIDIEHTRFTGKDWAKQLQTFFDETLPNDFNNLLKPLAAAVGKIDPLVRAWGDIITALHADIEHLNDLQTQFDAAMDDQITQLHGAFATPHDQFQAGQGQLAALQGRLEQAQPADRLGIAGPITELVQQLFATARGNFQADPHAADGILHAFDTIAQQFQGVQDQLSDLLHQFYGGDVQQQTTLAPQLQQTAQALFQLARTQATEARGSFRGDPHAADTVLHALNTAAEQFQVAQGQLAELLQQFYSGDAQTQATLAPQLQQTATALFQLARSQAAEARGSFQGDPRASEPLRQALQTTAEQFQAAQGRLAELVQQFYGGDAKTQAGLAPQIQQMATAVFQLARTETAAAREAANQAAAVQQAAQATLAQAIQTQTAAQETLAAQQAIMHHAVLAQNTGMDAHQTAVRGLRQGLYGPAEQFMANQARLQDLMARFRGGDAATKALLGPEIERLASETLGLARGQEVLGQDVLLLRRIQEQLIAQVQEVAKALNQAELDALGQAVDAAKKQLDVSVQAVAAAQAHLALATQALSDANAHAAQMEAWLKTLQQGLVQMIDQSQGTAEASVERLEAALHELQQYLAQVIAQSQGTAEASLQRLEAALHDLQQYLAQVISQAQGTAQQTLEAYQQALIAQLQHTQAITDAGFDTMRNALQQQITLATGQMDLLVASLGHLETVDGVVAASRTLLGQINTALGNPLQVSTAPGTGDAAQFDLMTSSNTYLGQMRDTLKGIAILLGARGPWSFQHGSFYVPFTLQAQLHQGERVMTAREVEADRGTTTIHIENIHVQGGGREAGKAAADAIIREIETRGSRLGNTRIRVDRRLN